MSGKAGAKWRFRVAQGSALCRSPLSLARATGTWTPVSVSTWSGPRTLAGTDVRRAPPLVRPVATKTVPGPPCCCRRATYKRPHGVRHRLTGSNQGRDRLYGHIKATKGRTQFLEFRRSCAASITRGAGSPSCWTTQPAPVHQERHGDWPQANNNELAYVPTYTSPLNRIEPDFTALRNFCNRRQRPPNHRQRPYGPPLHPLAEPQQRRREAAPPDQAQTLPDLARTKAHSSLALVSSQNLIGGNRGRSSRMAALSGLARFPSHG